MFNGTPRNRGLQAVGLNVGIALPLLNVAKKRGEVGFKASRAGYRRREARQTFVNYAASVFF